ncbi:MAG: hypothetical protein AAGA18_12605 [Verrucomicrobiota bacterium]
MVRSSLTLFKLFLLASIMFREGFVCAQGSQSDNNQALTETERNIRIDPELRPPENIKYTFKRNEKVEEVIDHDLGVQRILKREPVYQSFFLFGDYGYYHTDNPLLLETGNKQDDSFRVGRLGGSFLPKINEQLYGEVTLSYQWFRYDENWEVLDFDSLNVGGGLTWLLPDIPNLSLGVRYNYNLLRAGSDREPPTDPRENTVKFGEEIFLSHSFSATIQYVVPLSKAHYTYLGYSNELLWTDDADETKVLYSIFTGYGANITRNLSSSVYYKLSFVDYQFKTIPEDPTRRQDLRQNISLTLKYKFTEWLQANISSGWTFNHSNAAALDYEALSLGANSGLELRF